MKKIIYLIVFILIFQFAYSKKKSMSDIDTPDPLIGLQKTIYLSESVETVLGKINDLKLNFIPEDINKQGILINPYTLLAKKFNYNYSGDSIVFKIDDENYYLSFEENIFIPNELYILRPRSRNLSLQYLYLKDLMIDNKRNLEKINPHLDMLKLSFYKDKVYQILFRLDVNLDELNDRLLQNNKEFGRYQLKKVKKKDIYGTLYYLTWNIKDIQISMILFKDDYQKLNKIDHYRSSKEEFYNRKILVKVSHKKLYNETIKYKSDVFKNLSDMLKKEIDHRYFELKKLVESGKRQQEDKLNNKNKEKYKNIRRIW